MFKRVVLVVIIMGLFLCCHKKEISTASLESHASQTEYVLSEDKNDVIVGISIRDIYPDDVDYQELRDRGFQPDKCVYYSNDTKMSDTTVYFQNNKIIMYKRVAYKAVEEENQLSLDFK